MSRRTLASFASIASLLPLLPLVPLALGAAACTSEGSSVSGDTDATVRRVSQPIVNGTPSTAADDAVVHISMSSGGFCTGTLIAPNLVLTARHCVSNMSQTSQCGTFTSLYSPSTLSIALGVKQGSRVATATKIFVDAGQTNGCSNDIALFQLDKNLTGAKTSKVRLTKLTIGEAARTVGYGDNGSGTPTNGRYEKNGIKIDSVGPGNYTFKTKSGQSIPVEVPVGEIVTGESTCFGDSGGPLFDGAGNVIGVTSRGIDDSCIDRPSIYSDTASHVKLITDAAAAAGHPLSVPTEPPTGPVTEPEAEPPVENPDPPAKPRPKPSRGDSDLEDGDTEEDAPKKKSKPAMGAQPAACSVSRASLGASAPAAPSSLALAGLALAGVLVVRRRRHRDRV